MAHKFVDDFAKDDRVQWDRDTGVLATVIDFGSGWITVLFDGYECSNTLPPEELTKIER